LPKRKKKVKVAFWKKSPEIQRITDHIGKFIDRVDPKGISDLALAAGVSYMGYKTFGNDWKGAVVGLTGLKLAQVPSGGGSSMKVYSPLFGVEIPMSSQTVGLGILAALGIGTFVLPSLTGAFQPHWAKTPEEPAPEGQHWVQRYPSGRWVLVSD